MSYYPQPYSHNKNKIKIELDLSNHATKSDVKKQQVLINTAQLTKKTQ